MKEKIQKRIMIAGTHSGCGKTTISNAISYALKKRGISLCGFKCGPDYIDPMFHNKAIGVSSYNLDLFFIDKIQCMDILSTHIPQDGIGIIEGVMGFYDGVGGTTSNASSAQLALFTNTPSIIVVRPKGQSLSVGALLHGFKNFEQNTLAGVIFNEISPAMYPMYKEIVQKIGLKVYGYMPKLEDAQIPSRHLGLVTANELDNIKEKLEILAQTAEKTICIDEIIKLSQTAGKLEQIHHKSAKDKFLNIAVAKDNAFCFYYQDNIDILEQNGANIIYFSPLEQNELPKNISGLYIGGGYPELYIEKLSENSSMRLSIKNAFEKGLPIIAECGGFMYLHSYIKSSSGQKYEMCDIIDGCCEMTKRLQNFGYISMTSQKDCLIARKNETIRSHEFHYSQSTNCGSDFIAKKANGKTWNCVHSSKNLYAGYPHLYFRTSSFIVDNFLKECNKFGGLK